MRWALFKVCVAVTTMVALAFLIPLGLMVRESAREHAFTAAERQAAAIGPALAITTDQDALRRALASMQDSAAGLIAIHLPRPGAEPGDFAVVGQARVGAGAVRAAAVNGRSGTLGVAGGFAYLEPVAVSGGKVAVVEVFIPDAELTRGVTAAWLVLSGVALVLVLISIAVADRLGTRIVGAARRLAGAARALGEGDLAVRVPQADGSPPELRAAAEAFNAMADRVVRLLAAERELAADLSHRLRTPLTVLRLNAASLGQGVAADQTRYAVAQLEREVDQIIRAFRGRAAEPAPTAAEAATTGCDAAEVIRDRAAFWSALAEDEGRDWQLAGAERPVRVPVAATELGAALDAMLGNVFRHTEEGTPFAIDVHETADGVIVLVSDAGPGIDDPDAALRRGVGAQREGSTGLGLDIVRRVAEGTGGDVAVGRSVLGGTEIRVRLLHGGVPAPRAPRRRVRAGR